MPLIRINAENDRPVLHNDLTGVRLAQAIRRRDPDGSGPVIIMIHGFKYAPGHSNACPHRSLFAANPAVVCNWPRALGFGLIGGSEGLGIAFGWRARGTLHSARRRSAFAGHALSRLISQLRQIWPERPIHILCHSMGSEVVFAALPHLPAGSVNRIILMMAASFRRHAESVLATQAGRTAEVINVTSRENDLFDFLCERLLGSLRVPDGVLGTGLNAPGTVTLQLDCPVTLAHLSTLGRPIDAPEQMISHCSAYRRRGALRLYSDLLRHPDRFSLDRIRNGLPAMQSPRWSRLLGARGLPGQISLWHRPLRAGPCVSEAPRSATT